MAKRSNVNSSAIPYPEVHTGNLRAEAEKHGNSGANKQLNATQARSEAVRHGSLGYNEQISAGEMRADIKAHRNSSLATASKHERDLAKIDSGTGSAKGGN